MKKKLKIYLAGKITGNWWRKEICDSFGNFYPRIPGQNLIDAVVAVNPTEYYLSEYDAGEFIITGPHSLGCDHRCFHMKDNGAKHAATGIDWENSHLSKEDVLLACTGQIDRSDLIFCYIDSVDAYGTIAEIGYSYAKSKFICIVFKTPEIKRGHWFVDQMASESFCENEIDIRSALNQAMKDISISFDGGCPCVWRKQLMNN